MHSHHHHHHDNCSHSHEPSQYGRAFLIGITLNVVYVGAEVFYGLLANSLALLADATHNMGDILGLLLAWGALLLAKRAPDARYTYGLQSATILAALANAMFLLLLAGGIGWEALKRFDAPVETASLPVMAVAALGVVVNGITAWLFLAGSKNDLNIRGAFLHMAADALVSLGVVATGALLWFSGWAWLDPLISLLIAGVIIAGTWGVLREAFDLTLQATPKHIKYAEVKAFLASQPGVLAVHDLHIWAMSTNETALTTHLKMQSHPEASYLHALANELEHHFRIGHSTVQVEVGEGDCVQQC